MPIGTMIISKQFYDEPDTIEVLQRFIAEGEILEHTEDRNGDHRFTLDHPDFEEVDEPGKYILHLEAYYDPPLEGLRKIRKKCLGVWLTNNSYKVVKDYV